MKIKRHATLLVRGAALAAGALLMVAAAEAAQPPRIAQAASGPTGSYAAGPGRVGPTPVNLQELLDAAQQRQQIAAAPPLRLTTQAGPSGPGLSLAAAMAEARWRKRVVQRLERVTD